MNDMDFSHDDSSDHGHSSDESKSKKPKLSWHSCCHDESPYHPPNSDSDTPHSSIHKNNNQSQSYTKSHDGYSLQRQDSKNDSKSTSSKGQKKHSFTPIIDDRSYYSDSSYPYSDFASDADDDDCDLDDNYLTISDFDAGSGQVPGSVNRSHPYENMHFSPCHSRLHYDQSHSHKKYNDHNAHYDSSSIQSPYKSIFHVVVNPFEQQFDFTTKDSLYAYTRATVRDFDFKRIHISTESAEKFMDMINDKAVQFSWDPIINIPTSGSGLPSCHLCLISNLEIFKADLSRLINILEGYQSISLMIKFLPTQDGFMAMNSHISHLISS